MKARRACVLASGGLDSCVLVADMLRRGYEVHPLYVRCGLRWEPVELVWLKRYLRALRHPRLKPLALAEAPVAALWGRHWSLGGHGTPSASAAWDSVYLPGRNLTLLCQAGLFCHRRRIPLIVQAVLKGNPFPDASPRFFRAMEWALREALRSRLRISAPYAGLGKDRVARLIAGLPLDLTFSCLKPKGLKHCGRCSKCEERRKVVSF